MKKKYIHMFSAIIDFNVWDTTKIFASQEEYADCKWRQMCTMFIEISPFKMGVFVNNKELVLKQCCLCIELRVKIILPLIFI